ncbi:MAG: PEGA domain-containing protein, partial [candidate division Zixibacteria bacterium]|nr:PEGA domain-containing protein [candidate division Zixibacteria bacterium]
MYRFFALFKQIFTVLFLTIIAAPLFAELSSLQIEGKPEKSSDEFISRRDANGRICAAIQVLSDMEGFAYDSYNGIVGDIEHKPGMDIVFLQPSERVLQIFQTGYEPLKIILSEIGIQLNSKDVWKIRITSDKKLTELPVVIITKPSGALVFIDNKNMGTGEQFNIRKGNHQLKLVKDGYQPQIETISIDANNTLFKYTLQEIEDVDLMITSEPDSAMVYIDNVKFGTTPISDFYPAGKYPIRIEKEWYVAYEDYIDIQPPQTKENYKLNPDFGSIEITSSPQNDMDIYFNGVYQNVKTPHIFNQLRPGLYKVNARSQYYESNEIEVQLQRGKAEKVGLISKV